jgi:hypothetical protein
MGALVGAGGRSAVVAAIDVTYVLREGDCRDGCPFVSVPVSAHGVP